MFEQERAEKGDGSAVLARFVVVGDTFKAEVKHLWRGAFKHLHDDPPDNPAVALGMCAFERAPSADTTCKRSANVPV